MWVQFTSCVPGVFYETTVDAVFPTDTRIASTDVLYVNWNLSTDINSLSGQYTVFPFPK